MKVLWLSPNFNHYKGRFLNLLVESNGLDLTVLAGGGVPGQGHEEIEKEWSFVLNRVNIHKSKFGFSRKVLLQILRNVENYDWVLIPREKKNITLIIAVHLYRRILRKSRIRLISYNHPFFDNQLSGYASTLLLKLFYKIYDRIIFYNQKSCQLAIEKKVISPEKAFWANNTIDNNEIERNYTFSLPDNSSPNLLFIGRLISTKNLPLLINYFVELKKRIPRLTLDIVGDGPERERLLSLCLGMDGVNYHGLISEEEKLAPLFKKCSAVFIPGHSGLSINHAFHYGRPYITLKRKNHAPEIHYLKDSYNGYILDNEFGHNLGVIEAVLKDEALLNQLCHRAKETGKSLSVQKWCKQILYCLNHESRSMRGGINE